MGGDWGKERRDERRERGVASLFPFFGMVILEGM